MSECFRAQTLELMAKTGGILTDFVTKTLQNKKDLKFKPGSLNLGPGVSAIFPENPIGPGNKVNIMFQFRGGSAGLASKAGLNAVIIMADQPGIGGGPSRQAFGNSTFVNNAVSSALSYIKNKTGKDVFLGNLGFSGWSGGYDPIHGIMSDHYSGKKLIKNPDYIGLFDGMHHSIKPNNPAMKVWEQLAKDAQKGKTKFVITHTAVKPDKYPSTTDTSNYLLSQLGLQRQKLDNWHGNYSKPVSYSKTGNFEVYQLYDTEQPYMISGKTNVPGTSGNQHIQALRSIPDFWPSDWSI